MDISRKTDYALRILSMLVESGDELLSVRVAAEQVDVPYSFARSIQHGLDSSPYADGYANIESMDYEGNTVTLHLSHFTSDMMYYFSSGFLTIIDSGELESMSNEELMWGAHPYGPYYIANPEDYVSGSELTLTRFDDFKCENPEVENHGPMA